MSTRQLSQNLASRSERIVLLTIIMVAAVCGLIYEMVIGTVTSEFSSDGSANFSFVIGLYLFAMGLGSALSKKLRGDELQLFLMMELVVGVLGGCSAAILTGAHALVGENYRIVMIVLTLIIGTGVGLEIPLMTRYVARESGLENALADVLSYDYMGSLVASLLFPAILLPGLGPIRAALLIGVLNLATAMLAGWLGRIQGNRSLWIAIGVSIVVLVGGFVVAG
jgi:spermidine synthase